MRKPPDLYHARIDDWWYVSLREAPLKELIDHSVARREGKEPRHGETVPINLRASAMAVSIFMIHLFGDMWSPEILGRIADATGSLAKAVLILPVALIVAAALWLALAMKTRRANGVQPLVCPARAEA